MRDKVRQTKILNLVPKGIKNVLDIGSRRNLFKEKFKTKTIDAVEEPDIKQDLNLNQKLNFKDNSFDLVVLNQILEHLSYVEEIIKESKRVSKKYILVGLPNEAVYSLRIKFLFGKIEQPGYQPYGHKHRYGIKETEEFIKRFFGKYERKVYFGAFTGAQVLPEKIINFLANKFPSLFAKEIYYLIKIK
jgi:ubiquinone/menaquinone biosynthesis C-methylase UbiE